MLNEIIANIPADPTKTEVLECVEDRIEKLSDYTELLGELLSYGMPCEFEDRLMGLLARGVRVVNDDYETSLFQ